MRRGLFFYILMFEILLGSIFSHAADFKDEGKTTNINVEVGKVTEITFPAKVSKVVKGGEPDSVLVEVLDNSVYVLPKTNTPPDIFVTTALGSSYPLNLHLAQEHDIKVQVAATKHNRIETSNGIYTNVMDLMKDLLLDKEPAGATILPQDGQVLFVNKQIQLRVSRAYELVDWKAYILIAKNLCNNSIIIPIEQMTLPNLLAVSADQDMLKSKGQEGDTAKVYLVIGK